MVVDPLANLLELATAAPGDHLPAAVLQWLQQGAVAYIDGKGLEHALGLRGGPRTAAYRLRKTRRDLALRNAWQTLDGSPWQGPCALAAELARFRAIVWPRWRGLSEPPTGSSQLHSALWRACQTRASIPTSARRLHGICAGCFRRGFSGKLQS